MKKESKSFHWLVENMYECEITMIAAHWHVMHAAATMNEQICPAQDKMALAITHSIHEQLDDALASALPNNAFESPDPNQLLTTTITVPVLIAGIAQVQDIVTMMGDIEADVLLLSHNAPHLDLKRYGSATLTSLWEYVGFRGAEELRHMKVIIP